MARTLLCYAEGRTGDWEAICLDLDIAVQGETFAEVYQSLHEAIDLYIESVCDLSETDRRRLLNRKAPLSVRMKFLWLALRAALTGRTNTGEHAEFTLPVPA